MINGVSIYSIVVTVLMVVFGFVASYIRTKSNLISKAGDFINKAEEDYKSVSKAGAEKFSWVVYTLHSIIPAPMRIFITEDMIAQIVQKARRNESTVSPLACRSTNARRRTQWTRAHQMRRQIDLTIMC